MALLKNIYSRKIALISCYFVELSGSLSDQFSMERKIIDIKSIACEHMMLVEQRTSWGEMSFRDIFQKQPPEVFYKKGVLRNFAKFTRKHLCKSLLFNKVAGLRPATLLKKRLWHRRFPVNFSKFLTTSFAQNTAGRLTLKFET